MGHPKHMEKMYQAQLETILDNIVDGLITIDARGIVQSYNKACERIFGYAAAEVLGQNVNMLMPNPYAARHDNYLSNYMSTGEAKIIGSGREVEGRRKDGSVFPVDLSVAEIKSETGRFFSGIVRDITARKAAETELRRSNEELEKFAYVASHDLKAPLRNIDDLARWVMEDTQGVLPADAQEKLSMLCGRVRDLETLLEDILSYSRAGRIVDDPLEIDTHDLAARVAETHVQSPFSVRIEDRLPVIVSSRTPLEQIFGNLLSNAVKHHDRKEGLIVLSAREANGFVEFIVRDDGPGIAPEFHDRVFQMFQTLQSRDKVGGSGLGLAIIKKLVEWQGGRVWIESDGKNRGAAIHFTWPRHPGAKAKSL
jgi:two-component system, LuxR family, sensor kinase FixL